MTDQVITYGGGRIFDGTTLHQNKIACFRNGVFAGLKPDEVPGAAETWIDLEGDILSPGYLDLQVNGGDGIMFNDAPSVSTLRRIAQAHRHLGTTRILPTLISDSRDKTRDALDAAKAAIAEGITGIEGVHLEGPHLSIARKGAHDAQYIRPMDDADQQLLIDAKMHLPVLKITIAPENVSREQVRTLSDAGVLVSLGHTDADYETCLGYANAGACCATHLFNAMSQMGNRSPGLVGAVLDSGQLSSGLIADGVHVHPAVIRAAWAAKTTPGQIFLVSDAMAVAGTDLDAFQLNRRTIKRHDGQLRLQDGTLAGADLDLTKAIFVLVNKVGITIEAALAAATSVPAQLCGLSHERLTINVTQHSDMIRIRGDLSGVTPLGCHDQTGAIISS